MFNNWLLDETAATRNKRNQLDHLLRITAPHERIILTSIGLIVLAALKQAKFDEIREQDLSSEAAQSTERISQRWQMLTFLTSPSAWLNRASQEFMEATINYDKGLREGVFTYRFVSGARPT